MASRVPWPSKKLVFRVHGWLGLNLGVLLFIVCFSGTVATVSYEIDWLLNPAQRASPVGLHDTSWDQWLAAVRLEHPEAEVISLSAPPTEGWAASALITYGQNYLRYVYLDPVTAEVQGTFSHFNVARFFRSFHKQFYIYPGQMPHGVYIVGPLGIALLLSALTGLWFYRIRVSDLLPIRWPTTKRRLWSTLHRAGGVWGLAFSLIFAVTGIWYLVERVIVDADLYQAEAIRTPSQTGDNVESRLAVPLTLDESLSHVQTTFPGLDIRSVSLSQNTERLTFFGQTDAKLVRDRANFAVFDRASGTLVEQQRTSDLTLPERLAHTADPLHFGNFAGLSIKLLWLVAGLIISASILVGTRIWALRVLGRPTERRMGVRSRWVMSGLVTLPVLALATHGSIVNIAPFVAPLPEMPVAEASGQALSTSPPLAFISGREGSAPPRGQSHPEVPPYVWLVVGAFVGITLLISSAWVYWLR